MSVGSRKLQLHFACRRLLPLLKSKIWIAEPGAVQANTYSFEKDTQPSPKDLEIAERLDRIRSETGWINLPVRWSGYLGIWFARRGQYLWTLFSVDPFIAARITGKRGVMKIPRKAAWILDGGRGLDRLVKHKI